MRGEATLLGELVPRGEVSAGVAGRGTLEGDSGVPSLVDGAAALLEVVVVLGARGAGVFFCCAVDAVSSASWRIALLRGEAGAVFSCLEDEGAATPAEAATAAAFEGVPPAGAMTGAFKGVVVTEVDVVATTPIASFTSPNSFQSSSCSRS